MPVLPKTIPRNRVPPFFSESQTEIFTPLIWLHAPKNYPKSFRTDFIKRIHGLRLTHNKSYRKGSSCVKISVTEGGKGDTTQHIGICTGTTDPDILQASKEEKGKMLDEFTKVTGLHRKAAIRLLNRVSRPTAGKRRGRTA